MSWKWKLPWIDRDAVSKARAKIAEHEEAIEEIKAREPYVQHLEAFAMRRVEQNHLTELILDIPRRRRHA